MTGRALLALAALACAGAVAGPALAHHSYAMFDNTKLVVLHGTVLSYSYVNPHAWISVTGSPDEATPAVRWDVEATSPLVLAGQGLKPENLKAGDKVTVALRPLRDGRYGGSMVFVVTADGVAHGAKPENLGLDMAKLKP
ncbi:MAG TPA: DUF6152 family protein [Caulobacteraceae bacterium]|jgi:hypothetical protein